MDCAVSLECVRYISVHFCLNIRQLTELWIWDLVANGWPSFRCAVLFMFAMRRDSWASNPNLSNASHAWRRVSKRRSGARPSCSVRHVGRTCIALFFQGRVHGESPFCVQVRFKPMVLVVQDQCCILLKIGDNKWILQDEGVMTAPSTAGLFWMLYPGQKKKSSGSTRSSSQWIR